MKMFTFFLVMFLSLMVNAAGIFCHEDNRMSGGSLRDTSLSYTLDGFVLQSQFIKSWVEPIVESKEWVKEADCIFDDKSALSFCQTKDAVKKIQIKERREVLITSLSPDEKKKTVKYTDIVIYENDEVINTITYLANECELFNG